MSFCNLFIERPSY